MTPNQPDLRSPPYSMPDAPSVSPVKTRLLAVLSAQRALAKAVDALADEWAADLSTRNRPKRQQLTAQLVSAVPKPLAVGEAIYAIADECGIDL